MEMLNTTALLEAGSALTEHTFITPESSPYVVVPAGYKIEAVEHLLDAPQRARGRAVMTDAASFSTYVQKHDNNQSIILYADVKYQAYQCVLLGILNDHEGIREPGWRDFTVRYEPVKSVEWNNWLGSNTRQMSQTDFAAFIEENMGDIASVEGMPTGTQMLEMALQFEATSDKRFKSKINLQGGGVELVYVDQDDAQTQSTMRLFERFTIGLPVFEGGDSRYPLVARLKYRNKDGKLVFWYELVRADKVFRAAVTEELDKIKAALPNCDILNGAPGVVA